MEEWNGPCPWCHGTTGKTWCHDATVNLTLEELDQVGGAGRGYSFDEPPVHAAGIREKFE